MGGDTPAEKEATMHAFSPANSASNAVNSIGKQALSTRADKPSWGFGSCDRWYTRKMAARHGATPAPGAYNI